MDNSDTRAAVVEAVVAEATMAARRLWSADPSWRLVVAAVDTRTKNHLEGTDSTRAAIVLDTACRDKEGRDRVDTVVRNVGDGTAAGVGMARAAHEPARSTGRERMDEAQKRSRGRKRRRGSTIWRLVRAVRSGRGPPFTS